jgi:hypothetical protein
MFPKLHTVIEKRSSTSTHFYDGPHCNGCFNCARLHTTCDDILSKMGIGACWRPEGVALTYDEKEEQR